MRATSQHIPAEMLEEILLNLPVKSLLRFSSVSKPWNSIISGSDFVKRYRGHARKRVALLHCRTFGGEQTSRLISSISATHPIVKKATDLTCPFGKNLEDGYFRLAAACDDMWLAHNDDGSLFLWNPSMRTYKDVPKCPLMRRGTTVDFLLGLGYESVDDDYKILKIPIPGGAARCPELYSLRRNSWRNIQGFPTNIHGYRSQCASLSGKLHWLCTIADADAGDEGAPSFFHTIMSFDLSTNKFGEVEVADERRISYTYRRTSDMSVLRGMLCLSVDRVKSSEIWVMEEYGVEESWTMMFCIEYFYFMEPISQAVLDFIRPLYLYESGEIVLRLGCLNKCRGIFVYKDDGSRVAEVKISCCFHPSIEDAVLYVDSLASPSACST